MAIWRVVAVVLVGLDGVMALHGLGEAGWWRGGGVGLGGIWPSVCWARWYGGVCRGAWAESTNAFGVGWLACPVALDDADDRTRVLGLSYIMPGDNRNGIPGMPGTIAR